MFYSLLRNMMFAALSPEKAHSFSMNALKTACATAAGRNGLKKIFGYKHPSLEKNVFGLRFPNPVGLGAGFDKNAAYLREIKALGFGFSEIGTVTPRPQPGNDRPRLFRLPKDKAIINRMGFNNDGATAVRKRLEKWKSNARQSADFIIGGNIGKNKITPNEDAWKDYVFCLQELFDAADYFAVNVSSPNTPALRELQQKDSLRKIFSELENINQGKKNPKPILLKIAPDLSLRQLDDIVSITREMKIKGLIAANTTVERTNLTTPADEVEKMGAGGLSGKPLTTKSTEVLQYLAAQLGGETPIMASGGIFTAEDAKEKITAGASLLQIWTGFIYAGPCVAGKICKGLVEI